MNKFDLHALIIGFTQEHSKQLTDILSPLAINVHYCQVDTDLTALPKMHMILLGPQSDEFAKLRQIDSANANLLTIEVDELTLNDADFDISDQSENVAESEDPLSDFVKQILISSPYGLVYLLSPEDRILSLSKQQQWPCKNGQR